MRIALTGRLRSGKNHVAQTLGLPEFGFADPIKAYVDPYCPVGTDKNFRRRAYQEFGQWGRGNTGAPMTAERMVGVQLARLHGADRTQMGHHATWQLFGADKDFWVDLLLDRVHDHDAVAVCDARFPNELTKLQAARFVHVHVMCSRETRMERAGDSFDPKADEHISEAMARDLDYRAQRPGSTDDEMIVVWNDHRLPPPLLTPVPLERLGQYLTAKYYADNPTPEDLAALALQSQ